MRTPKKRLLFAALSAIAACLAAGAIGAKVWWPASPEDIFADGLRAAEAGDWRAVSRAENRLSSYRRMDTPCRLLRGMRQLKTGHANQAVKEFAQLQPDGELRVPALLYSGEAFYRLNRLSEAERLFSTLAAEHPDHVEAHRWLAAIAFDLGSYDHAMDELDHVLRLAPADYRPHLLKAYMLADVNRYRAAAAEYALVVAADPPREVLNEVLPKLARAQMQLREYAAALAALSRAERTAETLALQSECQLSLGQQEAAGESIALAREADPDDLEMLRVWGKLEFDAGRPEAALDPLRRVLERQPHHQECLNLLAQSLQQTGRTEEARAQRERLDESLKLQERLSELSKRVLDQEGNAEVREELAALYRRLGKPETAAVWSKAAAACRQMNDDRSLIRSEAAPSNPDDPAGTPAP